MHPTRTRPVPVTLVLLAVVAALVATLVTTLVAPADAASRRKPEHHTKYDVRRLDATNYLFFGKVTTDPGGTLTVLRKLDGTKAYRSWKKVEIRGSGAFRTRLSGSDGDCFRMRIPKTDGYRTTTEDLGCIVPR